MSDKLYYFTLGVVIMGIISMFVVRYIPTPKPDFVCGGCGSMQWHSVVAEGEFALNGI